jgi:ribonucleoside-diphosphate reductase alpha chain
VEAASRRQKWIDQAQSLNIYMAGASGKKLDETYKLAWLRGLKTTYYLRTIAATHMEKSTSRTGALNAVAVDGGMSASAQAAALATAVAASDAGANDVDGEACYLRPGDDGFSECEACQ